MPIYNLHTMFDLLENNGKENEERNPAQTIYIPLKNIYFLFQKTGCKSTNAFERRVSFVSSGLKFINKGLVKYYLVHS